MLYLIMVYGGEGFYKEISSHCGIHMNMCDRIRLLLKL